MHYVHAKTLLSAQNGMNLYRGCTHGCIYCDSRSVCYHMEHAFEDIEVKQNAMVLLEDALRRKRKKCMIGTGSMSDSYLPLEMELGYTRRALQLIYDYGFGVAIQTKSDRILRDLELLQKINDRAKAVVQITLTGENAAYSRLYLHNTASEKWQFLNSYKDGTITADTAGSYLLTNQNLRFTNINWTFFIAAGALTVVCLIVYIAVKKRYWFW